MMKFSRIHALLLILVLVMAGVLSGCGSIGNNDKGRLVFSITDAPSEEFKEVWVNIERVEAYADGEWVRIDTLTEPFAANLKDLRLGKKILGDAYVKPGQYSQIRIILDDTTKSFVILNDGSKADLKVPSGSQTGLKVNFDFTVSPGVVVALLMDIDANKLPHPNGKGYIMNPTAIRTINLKEGADVSGTVMGSDKKPITGDVLVTAVSADKFDNVTAVPLTEDNEFGKAGDFVLYGLAEGSWDITFTATGYNAVTQKVTVVKGEPQSLGTITLEKVVAPTSATTDTPAATTGE